LVVRSGFVCGIGGDSGGESFAIFWAGQAIKGGVYVFTD
jgi:hypothetical protein